MFGLLYDTQQQSECTRFNFLAILWPVVKVKVIETDIKL